MPVVPATAVVERDGHTVVLVVDNDRVRSEPVDAQAPAAESTLALATPPRAAAPVDRATDLVAVGTDLSELTDTQLQSLLGSLDGLDSRPQAEPTTITVSITQDVTQVPGRSNP